MRKINETELMNKIRIELSKRGYAVFRANVGKVRTPDGRWFDTGLPKGFSDLFCIKDGKIYFLETKVKPNKPTTEQLNFLKVMKNRYGAAGGVVYSVKEAKEVCGCVDSQSN